MKRILIELGLILSTILLLIATDARLYAQPEIIVINHSKNYVNKRQGPVTFPHNLHMENLECLDCHHKFENGQNVLDESELEEESSAARCSSCHNLKSPCDLQKAYHGLCLKCHITQRKPGVKSGPRMCIGCHEKSKSKLHGFYSDK